ncbi:hypothetical protein, partial [Actinomadura miaoliensis]|uniref:hypothetical protein n=1 Tax=Actinomadura miaoliensis TaxID=430685 RepID=UPI0031E9EE01
HASAPLRVGAAVDTAPAAVGQPGAPPAGSGASVHAGHGQDARAPAVHGTPRAAGRQADGPAGAAGSCALPAAVAALGAARTCPR